MQFNASIIHTHLGVVWYGKNVMEREMIKNSKGKGKDYTYMLFGIII